MMPLQLGHTPRAHDLFLVSALIADEIDSPLIFQGVEAGLLPLDQWAEEERLEVSRLSLAGLAKARGDYGLLNCGAVVGDDLGPFIIGPKGEAPPDPDRAGDIIIGQSTTLLLPLFLYLGKYPSSIKPVHDTVAADLAQGRAGLGVITADQLPRSLESGLEVSVDLGQWWRAETGLPLPLEVFAVRRALGQEAARTVDEGLRRSLLHAQTDPKADLPPLTNPFSADMGDQGREAVEALIKRAEALGLVPENRLPLAAY